MIFWASLILLLPFLALHWLVPLFSDLTLGNDYAVFHIQQQMELMFSLRMGVFPLYIPGFAGGHSYAALTLGQVFHPISHLAAALPGYWDGKALELNTLLRLLSLGGCHFMLFYFLRSLKLERAMAFVLSLITVYNMRMLDLFRYGAALESWTGFIFVCTFIGLQIRFPDKWFYRLATIGATYWLVCSGHPQMMYYGLLGVGIFALMAPYYIGIFTGEKPVTKGPVWKIYGQILFCLVAGVLLSAPYILSFHYEFLTTNARRVVQGYAWADDYRDTVAGTINNFVFPLRSDFHSAFGSAILFLPAIIIPLLRLMRIRIPTVIWAAWGLVIFLLLHSLGDRLPIHYLTWKYLPFASSLRIAGRILMIAPFFLMLIMVWLASEASGKITIGKRLPATPALSAMSLLAVILIGVWVYHPVTITADITAFSAYSVRSVPLWAETVITLAGVVLLLWFVLKPFYKRFAFSTAVCFCALLCLQVTLLLQYGTWIQKAEETPRFERMLRHKQEKLTYRNATGYGMASTVVLKQVENAYLEPYLGKLYSRWVTAIDNDDAYDLMKKGRTPDTVIVEAVDATLPKNHPGKLIRGSVKLTFSSFNRLVFDVNSSQMSLFGLSYPFNKKWRVSVNDRETVQYRANGASMAVVVPKGSSCVEFQYHSPATFWGMVIFFSSMSVLLIVFAGPRCHRSWHYMTLAIGLIICGGGFCFWNHSLYNGDNLATEYFWETKPAGDRQNLAYSKESHMIANLYSHYPYLYTSGQAVDGKRDFGDGFVTDRKKQPWWFVDLYTTEKIAEIHIYERKRSGFLKKYPTNKRPLRIMFSTDGDRWQEAAIITESEHTRPLKIDVDPPMEARYVMLQASGSCYLAIDEIEVYPPPKIEMKPEKSEAHLGSLSDKDPDV